MMYCRRLLDQERKNIEKKYKIDIVVTNATLPSTCYPYPVPDVCVQVITGLVWYTYNKAVVINSALIIDTYCNNHIWEHN